MFDEGAESESFIPQEKRSTQVTTSARFWSYLPWGTTLLFASLSLFQALLLPHFNDRSNHAELGAYETGWSTDFGMQKAARRVLKRPDSQLNVSHRVGKNRNCGQSDHLHWKSRV